MSELENYLRKFNIRPDVRKKQGGRAPFFRRGGHRSTGLKRRTTQYLGQYYQCIEWRATVGIAALASQLPPFISVYYRHNWFSINASMVRINLTWYSLAFSHLQSLRSTKNENWGHRSKNWTWGILGTNILTSAVDRLFIKSLPIVERGQLTSECRRQHSPWPLVLETAVVEWSPPNNVRHVFKIALQKNKWSNIRQRNYAKDGRIFLALLSRKTLWS